MSQAATKHWRDRIRLVEETPGVPDDERYYLWHYGVVWQGPTAAEGREWAKQQGLTIDEFERFEL